MTLKLFNCSLNQKDATVLRYTTQAKLCPSTYKLKLDHQCIRLLDSGHVHSTISKLHCVAEVNNLNSNRNFRDSFQ